MSKVTIDDKEYDTDDLSDEANAQFQSLQFVTNELTRLELKTAALHTARNAYANALKEELDKE